MQNKLYFINAKISFFYKNGFLKKFNLIKFSIYNLLFKFNNFLNICKYIIINIKLLNII